MVIRVAREDAVHDIGTVHDHRADLLAYIVSVVVELLWPTKREICSIGMSASESSETSCAAVRAVSTREDPVRPPLLPYGRNA
jgi:hypothetical protein